MNQVDTTVKNIKNLKIQGARAIAVASLNSLKKLSKDKSLTTKSQFILRVKTAVKKLKNSRPTEPLMQNCLNFAGLQLKTYNKSDLEGLRHAIYDSAEYLINLLTNIREKIIVKGEKLVKSNKNIFTHCHSSTVEAILAEAWQNKKRFKVFNTETRPLFQGRITAKNLRQHKIPVTMVADSASSFLISDASGKELMMDTIFIGADAILPDGSIINKIGSYGISLSAKTHKVPLYVVANLLKFDTDGIIPIEIRPEDEIWPGKPKGLKIINFAFDKIPTKNITGIICEFGIVKPSQVKNLVKKNYPWLI